MKLSDIRDLAYRFVPLEAADARLYMQGSRSWWPAHEIGHFLVATAAECRASQFGLDFAIPITDGPLYRYTIAREIAATSISQRLLRRIGHAELADQEIEYTDMDTLDCAFEAWCRRSVRGLLRANKATRLPTTIGGMEVLLARKARAVGTRTYASRRVAKVR